MKRFSLFLLSFLMCFSMFSCGDYTHAPSASSENTSSETVSDTSSQEVTSSEIVSSVEDTSSQELTSSEDVSSVEEIQVNKNIPQEDKEKALMYIDTLASMTLELGWEDITEVYFDNFILWFGYRDQKADNPVHYRDENDVYTYYPRDALEAEVSKYFNISIEHMRSTLLYSESEKAYILPCALYPTAEYTIDIVDITKVQNLFTIYFNLDFKDPYHPNAFIGAHSLKLVVEENGKDFKFASYKHINQLTRDYGQYQPQTQKFIPINGELYQSYVDEDTSLRYVFISKNEYSELNMFWHWEKDKLWDWIPIGTKDVYSLDLVGVLCDVEEAKASFKNTVKDPSQRYHEIGEMQDETKEIITIDGQSYQSYVNSASGLRHIFMSREEYVQLSGDELPDWKWAFIEVGTADVYSLDFIPFINASQK